MQTNAVSTQETLVATTIASQIKSINGFETITDEAGYKAYLATEEFAEASASAAESGYTAQCWLWDSTRAKFQTEVPARKPFNTFGQSLYVADYVQETPWAFTAYVRDEYRMCVPLWRIKKQGSTLAAEDSTLTEEQKNKMANILIQYGCGKPKQEHKRRERRPRPETGWKWEDDEE